MIHRGLGTSGLTVSVVGLGCNNFGFGAGLDAAQTRSVVDAALSEGVTFFDTADIYGRSEEFLGEALKGRRNEVVVATKFGSDMHGANGPAWLERTSRRYIRAAVQRSLRELRTDWIDLYQLHRPSRRVPIAETLSTLNDLVHEGLVRYIGCSNFESWEVVEAAWTARRRVPRAVRQRPERVQSCGPQGGDWACPGLRPLRIGVVAVLSTGERPAHRKVPTGSTCPAGQPTG